MQYRIDPKTGNKLSVLGLGCMRFPRNPVQIDLKKTEKLIVSAVENGINYFDTAYIYAGSEEALGPILQRNKLREKIFLATKLPLGKCKSYEDFDRLLNIQLERLKTDYIDYYFMHNITELKQWKDLCDMGVEKWIEEKKSEGKVKQVGFSFHGSQSCFFELLEMYPWDFCQIQYNYMNINYQAGKAGLKKAAEMGLPVFIMEPLLGGKLATGLPKKAAALFKEADSASSVVSWALKWLWDQPEVTVVLSGMSNMEQLNENVNLASSAASGVLTQNELAVFDAVEKEFNAAYKIPCTGCNYCMPCPHGVNIPVCFTGYNMSYAAGMVTGLQQYMTSIGLKAEKSSGPDGCIRCGKCEKLCPQHIPIMDSLKDVKKRMEPFWLSPILALARKLKLF